jgi:hypothetical protein
MGVRAATSYGVPRVVDDVLVRELLHEVIEVVNIPVAISRHIGCCESCETAFIRCKVLLEWIARGQLVKIAGLQRGFGPTNARSNGVNVWQSYKVEDSLHIHVRLR